MLRSHQGTRRLRPLKHSLEFYRTDPRDATNRMEENIETECFICGISAARLDREGLGFKRHVHSAHNKWMYVAFWMHLLEKQKEDFNGQESPPRNTLAQFWLELPCKANLSNAIIWHTQPKAASPPRRQNIGERAISLCPE